MGREATGSIYETDGAWFLALSVPHRLHFKLATCRTEDEAKARQAVVAPLAVKLRRAGQLDVIETLCRQAAEADERRLSGVLKVAEGLLSGQEVKAPESVSLAGGRSTDSITFGEFAELWTTGDLARKYRRKVKVIDHADNIGRLKKHVLSVVFRGRRIGDTPLREFTIDHADHVLAQKTLKEGSVRHVAQLLHRVLRLAVAPARYLDRSPLPDGWMPTNNPAGEKSYLFPSDDATLLACESIPLVRRLLCGFLAREGCRARTAVELRWSDMVLTALDGGGHVSVDRTKNGRGAAWALDGGTAEALRQWQKMCPSKEWVFPSESVPGSRTPGRPMYIDDLAARLRDDLVAAGLKDKRPLLFKTDGQRRRLWAHDLRTSFVTLSLAGDRSEAWIARRTGHRSSTMIHRYDAAAGTAQELSLGWFKPLHLAIPELARVEGESSGESSESLNRVS